LYKIEKKNVAKHFHNTATTAYNMTAIIQWYLATHRSTTA